MSSVTGYQVFKWHLAFNRFGCPCCGAPLFVYENKVGRGEVYKAIDTGESHVVAEVSLSVVVDA